MPPYRSGGVVVTLAATDLEQTTLPLSTITSQQRVAAELATVNAALADANNIKEYIVLEQHNDGPLRFLGKQNAPYLVVEARRESIHSQSHLPTAIILTVDITEHYARLKRAEGIKIEVFYNGEFAGCRFIPGARGGVSGTSQDLIQRFSGRRIDRTNERPWVFAPSPGAAHSDQQDENGIHQLQWQRVAVALRDEAGQRGIDKWDEPSPVSQYLLDIANEQYCQPSSRPGSLHFVAPMGIIDVVVSLGSGRKYATTAGYCEEPSRMVDERFEVRTPVESDATSGAPGPTTSVAPPLPEGVASAAAAWPASVAPPRPAFAAPLQLALATPASPATFAPPRPAPAGPVRLSTPLPPGEAPLQRFWDANGRETLIDFPTHELVSLWRTPAAALARHGVVQAPQVRIAGSPVTTTTHDYQPGSAGQQAEEEEDPFAGFSSSPLSSLSSSPYQTPPHYQGGVPAQPAVHPETSRAFQSHKEGDDVFSSPDTQNGSTAPLDMITKPRDEGQTRGTPVQLPRRIPMGPPPRPLSQSGWHPSALSAGSLFTYPEPEMCRRDVGRDGVEVSEVVDHGMSRRGMVRPIRKERAGEFKEGEVICGVRYVMI